MKLINKHMANQKLALSTGVVVVDAEGCVDIEDKAICDALKVSGFKPLFVRGSAKPEAKVETKAEVKEEVKEEAESDLKEDGKVSAPKPDHSKKRGR